MSAEFWLQLAVMILGAAATYGAIRQDIKNIHTQIENVKETADKAHERIDDILLGGRK